MGLLVFAALALPASTEATSLTEVKKLLASDAEAGDRFSHVAVSGDTAVVGAPLEDGDSLDIHFDAGAAYVFQRDQGGAGNWGEVKKLTASNAGIGGSVAVSGDTAVAGAPLDGAGGDAAGAVYIFQRDEGGADNWGEVKKLTASDAQASNQFGSSVAISGDTAVVGVPRESAEGLFAGAVYIFQRDEGGADNWGEVTKLTASNAGADDQFGFSVATSGDTAVVGAPGVFSFAGAVYILQRDEGGADNWGEVKKLTASGAEAFAFFGRMVAVSGDTALVGAHNEDAGGTNTGAAYLFQRDQGGTKNWGEVKKLIASDAQTFALFGRSVALSGDTAVVGAGAGAVYIFQRNEAGADNWGEVTTLTTSDAGANGDFGVSLAISGDTAVVGAPLEDAAGTDAGAAYVYDLLLSKPTTTPCPPAGCSTPTETPTPTPTPCPPAGCPTPTDTPTPTPTATPGGPEMILNVQGGTCDDADKPTKCEVPIGAPFTLSVKILAGPSQGYESAQSFLQFGTELQTDLTYTPAAFVTDEIVWPDCEPASALRGQFDNLTGNTNTDYTVFHGCLTGLFPPFPLSHYMGNFVELEFACSAEASQTEVLQLPYEQEPSVITSQETSGSAFSVRAGQQRLIIIPKLSNLTINCVAPPTPLPNPRMAKLPALQNVWLTRQGAKIPPPDCLSGSDIGGLTEQLSQAITSPDPKNPDVAQQIAAFEFEVHYDSTKVCVDLSEGSAWSAAGAVCIIQDSASKPQLEGVARIGCVTTGKGLAIDELAPLAQIGVYPQPDVYSQAKPNQDNGVVVQINNVNCDVSDEQGHAIAIFSCDDASITFRYLEGDVEPDCVIDALDAQAIAFRWGVEKGSLIYRDFMNLEPSGAQADGDIDVNDLQFVYGRFGSTCEDPHPPQPPVNPKA